MRKAFVVPELMRSIGRNSGILIAAAGLALVSLPAANAAEGGADITKMCGDKPMRVALTDGFGGNTWRKTTLAEFREEASKCANVTEVLYMDAGGDQQKYNGDINSLVAQNVNVIVTFTDFGEASIPAYRSAIKAGTTVVPYFSVLPGKAGRDFSGNVHMDQTASGVMWADWYGKNLKEGNIIFFGGIPGASSSVAFLDGLKQGLKKYSGIKLLDDNFIVTNWSAVEAQKATSGLIAKYPKIDGLVTDYGVTALAVVRTFQQAGLAVPQIATVASNVEINCQYLADKKAGKPWAYYSIDGSTTIVRYALRRAVALAQGTDNNEANAVKIPAFVDSAAGLDPVCSTTAPPDADLSSSLSPEALAKVFTQ